MKNEIFIFLENLSRNNNREWFAENKAVYEDCKENIQKDFKKIYAELEKSDALEPLKSFRIYRDIRFSKDKIPYKNHFSMYIGRLQPYNRGGYYLHIEPGNSFVGGGFWGPNSEDLLRIRQEITLDDELLKIVENDSFKVNFGSLKGESLKTAPKGFDKNHERIELLRLKQYLLMKPLTNEEVLADDFLEKVLKSFEVMRPFFDYMTDVLITNSNGEKKI